jgi:hypothetical protein
MPLSLLEEQAMPYIPVEQRKVCDGLIDELAGRIARLAEESDSDGAFAGLLNYACTRLALQVVRRRFGRLRYWLIATLTGTFKNISDEFYRRLAGPYEDKQMARSGDVDLYAEYLAEIDKMD